MATNQELTELMALDLGISITKRRPYANEVFKWLDIDLLPHSSTDTLLCEIYEWNGRNWRTTGNNLIGYLFSGDELQQVRKELQSVPKETASVPDFEFSKEQLTEFGFQLPSLFNIGFSGNMKSAKTISVKVNSVVKTRINNLDPISIKIMQAASKFSEKKSKTFRKNIKFNFLSRALFYAKSVEIYLEKEAGSSIDLNFDTKSVTTKVKTDTDTKKEIILTYNGNMTPFGANFIKGKDFGI